MTRVTFNFEADARDAVMSCIGQMSGYARAINWNPEMGGTINGLVSAIFRAISGREFPVSSDYSPSYSLKCMSGLGSVDITKTFFVDSTQTLDQSGCTFFIPPFLTKAPNVECFKQSTVCDPIKEGMDNCEFKLLMNERKAREEAQHIEAPKFTKDEL